jgi:alpha-ketoglutaric semialdehyde dehydrogenase
LTKKTILFFRKLTIPTFSYIINSFEILSQPKNRSIHTLHFNLGVPVKYQVFIDGVWQNSESGETYSRVNPADPEEILGEYQKGNAEDAKKAIEASEDAFDNWLNTPAPKRAQYILKTGELLQNQKEELSRLITREMGKTLRDSREDVQQAIDLAFYIAGEGRRLLGYTSPSERDSRFAFTLKVPIGTVGLITPWNFPILIPARKIFYSLVCGNTVVFKPSSEAPGCACKLVKILEKTGIPKGVVNLVTGPGGVVGNVLVADKRVRMVSFCGHKDTGAKIMRDAGPKRVSLELGGKNPLIIMDDADLDLAVNGVVCSGYATTGQRCTATSRVIVHEKVKEKVERMLKEQIIALKLGNGVEAETDLGPLVNKKAQDKTAEYCKIGLDEGARLLSGGHIPDKLRGWFFEPTLFTGCSKEMRVCQEEIFGPVVAIISFKNLDEAISIANSVDYGLSSAIYTANIENAFVAIKKLQVGITYVNNPTIGSEAHLPFGGVKSSGSNREGGPDGVNEFTETKTVYINYSSQFGVQSSTQQDKFNSSTYGSP